MQIASAGTRADLQGTFLHAEVPLVAPRPAPPEADELHAVLDVPHEVEDRLGTDDEVEGRGQGGAGVKVAHPEFRASELPFLVCVVLRR